MPFAGIGSGILIFLGVVAMIENANRETKFVWKFISEDQEVNHAVSEIVIRALEKHRKPQQVCFAIALDLRALIRKQCGFAGLFVHVMKIDWQLLSRAIMHEVIFGETNGETSNV